MKRLVLAALAAGTVLGAATPASAAIFIAYSVNGGAIMQLATDAATPGSASFAGTSGNYFFNVGGTGTPITSNPFDLLTQSINIQSTGTRAATLNVFVTETGLGTLNGGALTSAFTSNTLQNATATISSFYSPTNALYTGTPLQSRAFATPGTFTGTNVVSATGPFSLTVRYDIAFGTDAGNFNGTANITSSPVPEPATWAMMMLGFGGLGYTMRRRARVATRIRFA